MAVNAAGFLPESTCNTIDCVLERIQNAKELLTKCERCGLPTESVKQDLAEKEAQLTAIKREFFPNKH